MPSPLSAGQVVTFGLDAVNIPTTTTRQYARSDNAGSAPTVLSLNANSQTFQELLDTEIANQATGKFRNEYAEAYPNPFSDAANVSLNRETPSQVTLRIFNAIGQTAFRDYGIRTATWSFPLDAVATRRVYQVHIKLMIT
ncbi:MAG: hypothetical protein IPJ40_20265 [Saprospirales bacterium]|nr:hypothetical protein [Saprospirales bacterium]